jgi:hypothetical protein
VKAPLKTRRFQFSPATPVEWRRTPLQRPEIEATGWGWRRVGGTPRSRSRTTTPTLFGFGIMKKKDERKMKGKTCNKIVTKNVSQNKIFTNCHFSITMKKFNKINYLISALGLNYC